MAINTQNLINLIKAKYKKRKRKKKEWAFRNLTMFSNVLNSLIKITWRQKTNNNTKENKKNENNNNKRRKNAYLHCHEI